jgi:hypothetical protein
MRRERRKHPVIPFPPPHGCGGGIEGCDGQIAGAAVGAVADAVEVGVVSRARRAAAHAHGVSRRAACPAGGAGSRWSRAD